MKYVLVIWLFFITFSQAQLSVVTSIHPYYSLLEQLLLDDAELTRLLPPDVSPHTFDPTPRDALRLAEADLVVLNGGLDEWLKDLVEASGQALEVVEILELVSLEPLDEADPHEDDSHEDSSHGDDSHGDDSHGDDSHGHDAHDGVNPHIWLDPSLMIEAVPQLAAYLVQLDPENADTYRANAEALVTDLTALDQELTSLLNVVHNQAFVPFHDAWPYFARRYGLNLVVEIEPAPGREPSARYVAEALTLITESGAKAVFSEVQLPARPAEVVAENAGVALYLLDPIGGTESTKSYQDLLRYNAQVIANALSQ